MTSTSIAAQTLFLRALAQQESGREAEAIQSYTQLTLDHPQLPEPYVNLAVIYAGQRLTDKARTALEAAAQVSRSLANQHEKLGDVYAFLATQAYRQSLGMDGGVVKQGARPVAIRQLILAPLSPLSPATAPRRG